MELRESENVKKFYKQNEAVEYARKNSKLVFSKELTADGKRFYIVTDAIDIWNIIKKTQPKERYFHEVISDGVPCKLYFDLEFRYEQNPDSNGVEMTKIFVELVCWGLKKWFNICCDMNNVLWLTASSKEKFSSHIIFQIDNVAFMNNSQAGNFVHFLCYTINRPSDEKDESKHFPKPSMKQLEKLIVKNKDKEEIFCDLQVYRKNNNFRVYLSNKFGQDRCLILSKENQYIFHPHYKDEHVFLSSLVTYFENKKSINRLLEFKDTYKPKTKKQMNKEKKIKEKQTMDEPQENAIDEYQKILNDSLTEEEEREILYTCNEFEIKL